MSDNILDIEISYDAIEAPIFCDHKRGNNWAAVVTGKNAANATKQFLGRAGEEYDVELVKKGDILEIAADYRTPGGHVCTEPVLAVVFKRPRPLTALATTRSLATPSKAGHAFRASLAPVGIPPAEVPVTGKDASATAALSP